MKVGGYYCVACDVTYDGKNGLRKCRGSSLGLAHLWARIGYVQDWFPVKRPKVAKKMPADGAVSPTDRTPE